MDKIIHVNSLEYNGDFSNKNSIKAVQHTNTDHDTKDKICTK